MRIALPLALGIQGGASGPRISVGAGEVTVSRAGDALTVTVSSHPVAAFNGTYGPISVANDIVAANGTYAPAGVYVLTVGGVPLGQIAGETTAPADITRHLNIVLYDPATYAAQGRVFTRTGVWTLGGVEQSGGDIATRVGADAGTWAYKDQIGLPDGTTLEITMPNYVVSPNVPWVGVSAVEHAWNAADAGSVTLSPDVQQWDDAIGVIDVAAPGTQVLFSSAGVNGTNPAIMAAVAGTGYLRASGLVVDGSGFCLIAVAKLTATIDYAVALTNSVQGSVLATVLSSSGGKWRTQIRDAGNNSTNIDTGTGPNANEWAIVTLRANGTAWSFRVNGVELGTATVSGVNTLDTDQIGILGRYDGNSPAADGSGVALVMLSPSAPLTTGQVEALEAAAETYCGLSVLP